MMRGGEKAPWILVGATVALLVAAYIRPELMRSFDALVETVVGGPILLAFAWIILRVTPAVVSEAIAANRHGVPWYKAVWTLAMTILAAVFWVCFALAILYLFIGGIAATLTG